MFDSIVSGISDAAGAVGDAVGTVWEMGTDLVGGFFDSAFGSGGSDFLGSDAAMQSLLGQTADLTQPTYGPVSDMVGDAVSAAGVSGSAGSGLLGGVAKVGDWMRSNPRLVNVAAGVANGLYQNKQMEEARKAALKKQRMATQSNNFRYGNPYGGASIK